MSAKPIKCYIGNYDGQRKGMVYAASKREAAKVVGGSVYAFERYWQTRTPWPIPSPKVLTLYTQAYNGADHLRGEWQEGVCPL